MPSTTSSASTKLSSPSHDGTRSDPSNNDKEAIARQAVAATPNPVTGTLQTPTLEAILNAYRLDASNDKELLLELVRAKRAEDERLKALELKYAEQYHAANMIMYAQLLQQQQYQAQQASPSNSWACGYPSPLSPASEQGFDESKEAGPSSDRMSRKRSTSSVESGDLPMKRTKHEVAMAALRAKCKRNMASSSLSHDVTTAAAAPRRMQAKSPSPASLIPETPISPARHASKATTQQRQQARRLSPAELSRIAPRVSLSPPLQQATTAKKSFYEAPLLDTKVSNNATQDANVNEASLSPSTSGPVIKPGAFASLLNGSNTVKTAVVTSDVRSSPPITAART